MIRQEIEEQLIEQLVNRIEETNTKILSKIGKTIKTISTLSPSQAYQISNILKYGGSYEEIAKEIARVSGKNVQDIYKIFEEVAKSNKQFAKEFYEYRGIDYIPYSKDSALRQQVESIARLTAETYINIANTSMIGLVENGKFTQLQKAYEDIIDKAILSIAQGKENFYSSMRDTLKEIGGNGLVVYESGRKRKLDSVVRMNIQDGLRQLNNETNKRFGDEYGANMIEVSHHQSSAPDHIDSVDGKQFARIDVIKQQIANGTEKEIKLSDIEADRVKVKGKWYKDFDSVNNNLERQVSTLNCRHYIFNGILGISKPLYTKEQLEKDKSKNIKGFEYEGKHYTMYEGEQLQRKLELEIRKQKDTQILAKSSGDMELVAESQTKITQLTHKYNNLCKASGLKSKKQRMSVINYRRVKV